MFRGQEQPRGRCLGCAHSPENSRILKVLDVDQGQSRTDLRCWGKEFGLSAVENKPLKVLG